MNISIFGLGYVGSVGAGCFTKSNHSVIGVDINEEKVKLINNGKSPVVENGLDELMNNAYKNKLIEGTNNSEYAVLNSDISFITVGTPNTKNGHLDLSYIYNVGKSIAKALKKKGTFHVIVLRSTVEPGTNIKLGKIIEEESNLKNNEDFAIVSNPEFLREGTAVDDFFNPPYTLIASQSEKALNIMKELYKDINGEIIETSIEIAEIIKFVNNSYHGLKVVFANEIGRICKKLNIDSVEIMKLFTIDTKLNISPYYFRPGFAYGGSCLPKDLLALNLLAHDNYIDTPVLNAIKNSNDKHIEYAYNLIVSKQSKNIGFLGMSFKKGTDDIRYSPTLIIVEKLLGKGFNVNVYDKNINLMQITGKNKEMLFNAIPHIVNILYKSIEEVFEKSDTIVITYKDDEFNDYIEKNIDRIKDKNIIDFSGIRLNTDNYEGICW